MSLTFRQLCWPTHVWTNNRVALSREKSAAIQTALFICPRVSLRVSRVPPIPCDYSPGISPDSPHAACCCRPRPTQHAFPPQTNKKNKPQIASMSVPVPSNIFGAFTFFHIYYITCQPLLKYARIMRVTLTKGSVTSAASGRNTK